MIDSDICFIMRVRKNFNADFEAAHRNEKVSFEQNGKRYKVRVFKVTLSTGEQEILVTNLREKYLSRHEVSELYFQRWRIEVKLDSLKNKLELENMSGRRVVTTYQDFWAKLDLANTIAALEYTTNEAIEENSIFSNRKYQQITNENRLIPHQAVQEIFQIIKTRRKKILIVLITQPPNIKFYKKWFSFYLLIYYLELKHSDI